jgi:predicted porin
MGSVYDLARGGLKKVLVFGLALPALVSGAQAADFDSYFKAPPEIPDLTWHGITVIGAVDMAGQYESKGAPYAGGNPSSAAMITPWNRSPQWLIAPNQALQSFVGLKVDEKLNNELSFIARLEMGFNPTTGELSDALKIAQRMNGIPLTQQDMNGDGSRAGQIFNGEAWAGIDSKTWGTIHAGRNNSVSVDMWGAYDPLASYGFSLFGYVGSYLAGMGSTETARIDDSIKYLKTFGHFRTELMYGAPGTNVGNFFQGTVGIVYPNFSVDLFGGRADDQVSASALGGTANLGSTFLGARILDTTAYGVFAKYVFDLSGTRVPGSEPTFTLSGGFTQLDSSDPSGGGYGPGHVTIGGYQIGPAFSTTGTPGAGIVNYAFAGGDRLMDMSFIAGSYQYDSQLSFKLAYYRVDQNSFGLGVDKLPGIMASAAYSSTKCSSSSFFNCSGTEQAVSFRADYQWTKNLMLYGGITYSVVGGGLAFSYLAKSTYTPTVGARLTF